MINSVVLVASCWAVLVRGRPWRAASPVRHHARSRRWRVDPDATARIVMLPATVPLAPDTVPHPQGIAREYRCGYCRDGAELIRGRCVWCRTCLMELRAAS